MASRRCGCASQTCSCVVTAGEGVDVAGTGSPTNPYVVSAGLAIPQLTVQDENSTVRTAVTQLDFQGGGVTATTGGDGEVIVTVPGLSGGGLLGLTVNVQSFTTVGAGTWTKPANCLYATVEMVGGGGGSGGCPGTSSGQNASSAGGGGGGYARKVFVNSALAATVAVTVGGGGSAVAAGANQGEIGRAHV